MPETRKRKVAQSSSLDQSWFGFRHVGFLTPTVLEEGEYEAFHSSTSWIPIVAYVLMRNLCEWSRRRHLWLFSFVGRYTLEMSILQMHVLMRTEGSSTAPGYVVVLVRGSFFANLALVSVVFLFLSVRCGKVRVERRC